MKLVKDRVSRRRGLATLVAAAGIAAAGAQATPAAAAGGGQAAHHAFREVRLISDVPGLAQLTDPLVKNPWGIALSSTSPLWVANNGTSTATIYTQVNGTAPVVKVPLTVTTPPGVTGQIFNTRIATNPDNFVVHSGGTPGPAAFLFDTFGGEIAGWHGAAVPATSTETVQTVPGAIYTGLAEAVVEGGHARLYAADFGPGAKVDVFNSDFKKIGSFSDPKLPGMQPYNVAALGGKLYVAYAPAPGSPGTVRGAIDVFNQNGALLRRLVTGGALNGPWGMVIAPAGWGRFGGDLLVGNVDDGRIHAYDPVTGAFQGTVRTEAGRVFVESGLWGLAFGNGTFGTPNQLIYAAGINGYQDGLVGTLEPVR